MKSMTELTNDVQGKIGRSHTLLLLKRAGEAARASDNAVAPVHVLSVMERRIEQGWSPDKIAAITNGKLIKLARKVREQQHGS